MSLGFAVLALYRLLVGEAVGRLFITREVPLWIVCCAGVFFSLFAPDDGTPIAVELVFATVHVHNVCAKLGVVGRGGLTAFLKQELRVSLRRRA
ncbi:hypothetical protein [Paraeggerthella sp.]|uniref:hypothetical protein n=1 Tax=Paraeggerthella sp. TaxID=2897350 RepID=UPI003AB5A61F